MLVGQPGIGSLPRPFVWAQGAYSWFRRDHAGQADGGACGSASHVEDSPEDDGASHDGGVQAGLRDRGRGVDGQGRRQRPEHSLGVLSHFLLSKLEGNAEHVGLLAEPLGGPTRPFTHRRSFFSTFGRQSHYFGWAFVLLVLLPIQDTRPEAAEAVYDHLWKLFVRGQLIECQQRASTNYESFRISNPNLAVQLRLLEAEAMLWRGFSSDALGVLSQMSAPADKDAVVKKLALEGAALTRMERFSEADQKLVQAENLCRSEFHRTCGDVPRARGVLEMGLGQQARGQQLFLESLAFARYHRDPFLEASALVNLGFAALQSDHFDEAADWSRDANRVASELGADYVAEVTEGNLAWSYYALGDHDQALALFLDAEKRSINLGSVRDQIRWLENIGYVYESNGDLAHAAPIYHSALDLARKIDSKA